MNYRTKVFILLIGLALFSSAISGTILYLKSKELLFKEIQSKVLSIATTISSLTDGDLHEQIKTRRDEDSPAYKIIEEGFRKARNANRRDDVHLAYVYSMMTLPENPDVFVFGVDAEESAEDKSHVGDVYKGEYEGEFKLDEPQVDNEPNIDQWGEWISANIPLKNSKGDVVAAIGVDISVAEVRSKLKKVMYAALAALGVALVLAIVIAFLLSKHVSKPLYTLIKALHTIGKGNINFRLKVNRKDEFGEVAKAVNSMADGLCERETLKGVFARYVSQQVRDKILNQGEIPTVKGERRKITMLFSDIKSFTELSESLQPEEVVSLLNDFFEKMIEVVFKNQGMIDKFVGDGLVVIFGAPVDDLYQEEHAVRTALEMQDQLALLHQKWESEGREKLSIGIGINTGIAIVGNIGSSQKMEYTAIGDTVNLAARIESATRDIDASILISEYTYVAVKTLFKTENKGSVYVKGRKDPITVYSVLGSKING